MKTLIKQISLFIAITVSITNITKTHASDNWFIRPVIGLSQMSDLNSSFNNIEMLSGNSEIELNSGFNAGLGFGYRYTDNFALELAWEYRSNDSETTLANTSNFEDGNYASNIFFLNLHYRFNTQSNFVPYLGAGLSWAEEIDIDLERNGEELSFSSNGDTGFQVFAGLEYKLNESWTVQSELRYGSITGINLDSEQAAGSFDDLDYKTKTLQFGLVYDF